MQNIPFKSNKFVITAFEISADTKEIFNISIGYQVKDSYQFRMILQLNRLTERKIMFNIAKENRCSTFL